MKKHSREGVITHKFVEMMKLMNIYLNHFPKHEKQALCAQIRNTAYGLFNLITEGYRRYHKKTTLTQIDVMHEQLRMLTYLAYELGYFRFGAGEQLATGAEETEGHRYMAISRLIRKYSWRKFKRAVVRNKDDVAWSIIAHAQHTASMDAMGACIRQNEAMYQRLPEAHKRRLAA